MASLFSKDSVRSSITVFQAVSVVQELRTIELFNNAKLFLQNLPTQIDLSSVVVSSRSRSKIRDEDTRSRLRGLERDQQAERERHRQSLEEFSDEDYEHAEVHFVSEQKIRPILKSAKILSSLNQFFQTNSSASPSSIPPPVKIFLADSSRVKGRLVVFDSQADQNNGIIVIKPEAENKNNGQSHNQKNKNKNQKNNVRTQDYLVLKMSDVKKIVIYDENHTPHIIQQSKIKNDNLSSSPPSSLSRGGDQNENENENENENDDSDSDGEIDDESKREKERERGYELVQPMVKLLVRTEPKQFAAPIDVDLLYNTAGLSWEAEYIGLWKEDRLSFNMSGRYVIKNYSGKSFHDSSLTLVHEPIVTTSRTDGSSVTSSIWDLSSGKDARVNKERQAQPILFPIPDSLSLPDDSEVRVPFLTNSKLTVANSKLICLYCLFDISKLTGYKFNNTLNLNSNSQPITDQINLFLTFPNNWNIVLPPGVLHLYSTKDSHTSSSASSSSTSSNSTTSYSLLTSPPSNNSSHSPSAVSPTTSNPSIGTSGTSLLSTTSPTSEQLDLFFKKQGVDETDQLLFDEEEDDEDRPRLQGDQTRISPALMRSLDTQVSTERERERGRSSNSTSSSRRGQHEIVDLFSTEMSGGGIGDLIMIKVKNLKGVFGNRTQLSLKKDEKRKMCVESISIIIENNYFCNVDVLIQDSMYRWNSWKITSSSHPYTTSGEMVRWVLKDIGVSDRVEIQYTVTYSWFDAPKSIHSPELTLKSQEPNHPYEAVNQTTQGQSLSHNTANLSNNNQNNFVNNNNSSLLGLYGSSTQGLTPQTSSFPPPSSSIVGSNEKGFTEVNIHDSVDNSSGTAGLWSFFKK